MVALAPLNASPMEQCDGPRRQPHVQGAMLQLRNPGLKALHLGSKQ